MNEISMNKKHTQVSRTKTKIVDAYLAFIMEKNWESIHIKELCERAGVARGTFYQHFTDIYDVMEYAQSTFLAELSAALDAAKPVPPVTRNDLISDFDGKFCMNTVPLFKVWFTFCEKYKKEFVALAHLYNGDLYFPKRVQALLYPHLDAMMDRDCMPHDDFREHFKFYFFKVMLYTTCGWLTGENETKMDTDEMAAVINATRIGYCSFYYKMLVTGRYEAEALAKS